MSEYIVGYEMLPMKWRDGFGLNDCELGEEVVRCGDCEWFEEGQEAGVLRKLPNKCHLHTYGGRYVVINPESNGFCSWAIRRQHG